MICLSSQAPSGASSCIATRNLKTGNCRVELRVGRVCGESSAGVSPVHSSIDKTQTGETRSAGIASAVPAESLRSPRSPRLRGYPPDKREKKMERNGDRSEQPNGIVTAPAPQISECPSYRPTYTAKKTVSPKRSKVSLFQTFTLMMSCVELTLITSAPATPKFGLFWQEAMTTS